MHYTVGKLARELGLARSTLLYYERIGLLVPSSRTAADYRLYSEGDAHRLRRICRLRDAGMPLKSIAALLDGAASDATDILESRLEELAQEHRRLRFQQDVITRLLASSEMLDACDTSDDAAWASILNASGLDHDTMRRWHQTFHDAAPDEHRRFVEALGIPIDESALVQKLYNAPNRVRRLLDMSERFMELFLETMTPLDIHSPGDNAHTRRALSLVPDLPKAPRILDIGCGPGRHSIVLAKETGGTVTGIDVHQPVLDALTRAAEREGLSDRVRAVNMDMSAITYDDESFDLLWCEGSAFISGFDNGLDLWKRLLRPGGTFCVSELIWCTPEPPQPAADFFREVYPAMRTVPDVRRSIEDHGYTIVTTFPLPASCWHDYYGPFQQRLNEQREAYAGDEEAQTIFQTMQAELDMYAAHGDSYGYEFFIMQKPA